MSFAAFFSALSGLQANASRLSVIGNNLANVNTVGFKSSRVTFDDFFSAAGQASVNGAGNPTQVGRGTNISAIQNIFSQGSLQTTSLLTDLAIQGKGFFVLSDEGGGLSFTRSGNFTFDSEGVLVSSNGKTVQGFAERDSNGNILTSGSLTSIQIPVGLIAPPQATGSFNTVINLNTSMSDDFTTTLTVFDSLGERHVLTVTFTPTDTTVPADGTPDEWVYDITVQGDEIAGGTPGTPFSLGTGSLAFDSNGQLTAPAADINMNVAGGWTNGAAAQTIDWKLYDSDGNPRLTQFAAPSSISSSSQDGFTVGTLRSMLINDDGLISGIFSNGVNLQLARMALATFNNDSGLLRDGQSTYLETISSGIPTIGGPSLGGRGSTVSNSLELSNVDITQEFTDLIISQRGYQANSRVITTADEVVQEALSLKR